MEGQFVQHEETGFIRLQGQNKEPIIDESAQHQRRSELLYTSSRNGVRPSVRQKHSYIHVR